jgi:voltage-gated potassium channel
VLAARASTEPLEGPAFPPAADSPAASTVTIPPDEREEPLLEAAPPGLEADRRAPWRERLHEVIFEADTPLGRLFDVSLLVLIVFSVVLVSLETVHADGTPTGPTLGEVHPELFLGLEWALTAIFTLEYVLRLLSLKRPQGYVFSFFGLVDLAAILPTYLSVFGVGSESLLVIRGLRLMRVFRVLKLAKYVSEARELRRSIAQNAAKLTVFLSFILITVSILGAVMYLVEGGDPESGFTSIPMSMYWAVVTMTTVGYGDVAPTSALGRGIAAMIMILGYALIIVPTGILSAELASRRVRPVSTKACKHCSAEGHEVGAEFCKRCGEAL